MAKIFLMEDSPPLRRVLVRQIRDAGHIVAAFEDGEQSRNRGIVGDADVVITDLSMPGVDGEAAIRNIARLRPNLPIIVISGAVPDHVVEMKAVDVVLHKPFSEMKLVEAIESVLKDRNLRQPPNESRNATRFRENSSRSGRGRSWMVSAVDFLTGRNRRCEISKRDLGEACPLYNAPVTRSCEMP